MTDSSRTPEDGSGPGRDERGRTGRFQNGDPLASLDSGGRRPAAIRNVVVAAAGVWVVVSTLAYGASAAAVWNVVLVGIAVGLAGAYNAYRLSKGAPASPGVTALAAVLGLWLLGSTALFALGEGLTWSVLGSGLVVAVVAGYDFREGRRHRPVRTAAGGYDRRRGR